MPLESVINSKVNNSSTVARFDESISRHAEINLEKEGSEISEMVLSSCFMAGLGVVVQVLVALTQEATVSKILVTSVSDSVPAKSDPK